MMKSESKLESSLSSPIQSIPMADWMAKLPDEKKQLPLSQIAIPGTHDSFTYSLEKQSPVGPDEPKWMRRLAKVFGRGIKTIIYRWAKCQGATCKEQLELGIRYFDIRLAKFVDPTSNSNNNTSNKSGISASSFRVIHGLFGAEIESVLQDMKNFLEKHQKEVLILDFQHIFAFGKEDHHFLVSLLESTFGVDKLCPVPKAGSMYSLATMLDQGHRVVVIYPSFPDHQGFLWSRTLCPNPWPDTMNVSVLDEWLRHGLHGRDPNLLFVSQGVLTPSVSTVALHPFSTLEKYVSRKCNNYLEKWVTSELVKSGCVNIIISDFVESTNIPRSIVQLNF